MTTQPRCNHLSASSIAAFKACPQRFRLSYVEGLRPAEDTESLRMGSNWHSMFEVYAKAIAVFLANRTHTYAPDPADIELVAMAKVVEHLNERYKNMPVGFDAKKWEIERTILLTSFIGYQWYWANDPIEFLANELPFNLPLHFPKSGMPLPMSEVQRVGKIDHVVKWQGAICALERKSTSRSIDADSDYWDKSKKDTQVSMYALAFTELRDVPNLITAGSYASDTRFGNTLYDVWKKPTIKPCLLTQKETAEFIASGDYCGQKFVIKEDTEEGYDGSPDIRLIDINSVRAEVEPGKKGFAIRETVDMYAARLLQDITERPDFYFQRREIVRTDAEIHSFKKQLFAIYQSQKAAITGNNWYENEQQCRATFRCQYLSICYGTGAEAVCDGKTTPPGFKRIFVDLTIEGSVVESED